NDSDELFGEQPFGELKRGTHSVAEGDRDIGVDIECALRFAEGDAGDAPEPGYDKVTASPVFGEHGLHGILRTAEGFDGGLLGDGGRVGGAMALKLRHGADDGGGSECEANAPTGHGVGF